MEFRWYEIWQQDGHEMEIASTIKGVYNLIVDGILWCTGTKEECEDEAAYYGIYDAVA